ncbi:GspE/PulE/PilB domain-containing protein [Thalassoroseus pseudoceratinae]|uniref:GspE/PulE/PilB domain-containing protein n=1 Tax=Thalassoroseus pseudoceratinae TaxID=2713176 RepID=UPI001422E640|nr:general secretion pathway protein GspE [Thalassoroseus pseudoceratinae]
MDVYKDWLGIPEGERPPDYYTLLRLKQFEDDPEKVQKHYKKLNAVVRKYATGQYMQKSQDLLNELAKAMLCLTDTERKRDYDESLGREFDDADEGGRKPMLRVLVERKVLSRDQARETEEFAQARGLSHRDAVVQMKVTDAETATRAYAQELGRPYIDLSETTPDDDVLDRVPRNFVKRNAVLPLFVDDDVVMVACAYEPTPDLEEEIQVRYGMPMRAVMATPLAVNQGIAKYYQPGMRDEAVAAAAPTGNTGGGKVVKQKKSTENKSWSQLTPDEQRERKSLGIIMMCWGIIGSVMIDTFILPESLKFIPVVPFLFTLIVPPIVIWYVLKVYWK